MKNVSLSNILFHDEIKILSNVSGYIKKKKGALYNCDFKSPQRKKMSQDELVAQDYVVSFPLGTVHRIRGAKACKAKLLVLQMRKQI